LADEYMPTVLISLQVCNSCATCLAVRNH